MKYEKGEKVKKLSKKALMESALSEISNKAKVHITNIRYGDGYLVSYEANSVCWFNIKECRGWRFAFWTSDMTNECEKGDELIFFCCPELTLDKFKPSAVSFKSSLHRYTFKPNDTKIWEESWYLADVIDIINFIKKHKIKAFVYGSTPYPLYVYEEQSFLKCLFEYLDIYLYEYKENIKTYIKKKHILNFIVHNLKNLNGLNCAIVDYSPNIHNHYIEFCIFCYIKYKTSKEDIEKIYNALDKIDELYGNYTFIKKCNTKQEFTCGYNFHVKESQKGDEKILWKTI